MPNGQGGVASNRNGDHGCSETYPREHYPREHYPREHYPRELHQSEERDKVCAVRLVQLEELSVAGEVMGA